GGGAMLALSYVGVTVLFPEPLWPRILALVSGVWGVSALVGPLVGGVLASVGFWRGAFWAFALQGMALIALTAALVDPETTTPAGEHALPTRQMVALGAGVLLVSAAGVRHDVRLMVACAVAGLIALSATLRIERTAPH